ncbi:MAG TPA: DUF5723 family protein [Bacteroidota bacterium]|nr:DUF5723 family protein [Bacteroidota bacterium]
MFRRYLTYIILAIGVNTLGQAGDRTTIRGVGMGRTFVSASRGIDAIGINPANLAIPDRSDFSLVVLPFTYRVSTELFSYDIYQEFFTGVPDTTGDGEREPKLLTEADKNRLLSLLPEGKATTRMDVEAMYLGMSFMHPDVGGFGIAVTEKMGVKLDLAKEYFRMFLFGFQQGGSSYDFSGTKLSAWWYREYNFSYARRMPVNSKTFKDLYVGLGLKLVHGYGIMHTSRYSARLANEIVGTNQYRIRGSFDFLNIRSGVDFLDPAKETATVNPFTGAAGTGYGVDLGLTAEIISGLQLSFAVTDVGGITWKKNVVETRGSYDLTIADPFSAPGQDSLINAIRGKNSPAEPFTTPLPTTVRFGALLTNKASFLEFLPGAMVVGIDYNQGFNEMFGNSEEPRLSMGMEYRIIPLLPLRTGFSVGGGDGFRWGAGFGLDFHFISLDLATENFGMLFSPSAFQMFSVSFGLRFRG